ncbi:hypothetical protein LOD99_8322 [Oopsacas minuta]|uniref:Uncharacterized protein n=1 Tax=Oopsacas minuta TaxID=111878 RepID=A0AAV7JHD7_9METZ|nr:hypothetical protein LOD99_8322 [Oopsacas minuta]
MGGIVSFTENGAIRLGCPYVRFGCDIFGLNRKELAQHKQEHLHKHIDLISATIEDQSSRITELERQNRLLNTKYINVVNRISDVIEYVEICDEDIREISGQKSGILKNERNIRFILDRIKGNEKEFERKNRNIVDKLFGILKSVEENKMDFNEFCKQNDKIQLCEKELRNIRGEIEDIDDRVLSQGKRLKNYNYACEDERNPKRIKQEMNLPQYY